MQKTKNYSWISNKAKPPIGCQMCVKGEKLVMFVTGICPQKCFYCPISSQKFQKDVVYANEWKIDNLTNTQNKNSQIAIKNILEEAKLTNAKGAGFTGGDPLARLDRTVFLIKLLKQKFGKSFHIHLYTPLTLINQKNLDALAKAGLDELRLHPDITDEKSKKDWHKIFLCKNKKYKWDLGIEIPVIPGKEKIIKELIIYSKNHIRFLNLNELEISDTNAQHLTENGFYAKKDIDFGVIGSDALAKKLVKFAEQNTNLTIHYCTTTLKDKVQLQKRIKRRAKNVAKPFDLVTKEGMLVRGAIYLKKYVPGKFKKINLAEEKKVDALLENKLTWIKKEFKIPNKMILIDKKNYRILLPYIVLPNIKEDLGKEFVCTKVEEYPTWDNLIVELEII